MAASWGGHLHIARALLASGANIEARNQTVRRVTCADAVASRSLPLSNRMQHGWTALISAAAQGHYDVVVFLLDNGADALAADFHQADALCYARQGGHARIVRRLKRAIRLRDPGCSCYAEGSHDDGSGSDSTGSCQGDRSRKECIIS